MGANEDLAFMIDYMRVCLKHNKCIAVREAGLDNDTERYVGELGAARYVLEDPEIRFETDMVKMNENDRPFGGHLVFNAGKASATKVEIGDPSNLISNGTCVVCQQSTEIFDNNDKNLFNKMCIQCASAAVASAHDMFVQKEKARLNQIATELSTVDPDGPKQKMDKMMDKSIREATPSKVRRMLNIRRWS